MSSSKLEAAPSQPKYLRIRDQLYAEIRSGRLAPGQPLPTEAKLIESLGMSRNTVRQALAELENDGIIRRIQGRGTFVTTEQERHSRKQLDAFAIVAPEIRTGCYPSLIHGFEQSCASFAHQTLVSSSGNHVGRQADLLMQLADQSVGGIALVPTTTIPPTPPHQIRQLHKNRIPVVLCHRTVEGVIAPSIVFRGEEIGLKVGEKLAALGHRRIISLQTHRYSMVEAREQGLRQAFINAGLDPRGITCVEYDDSDQPVSHCEQAIQRVMAEQLSQPGRPTAVFCHNAPDAELVYMHAQSLGMQIPRDLSLLYFGGALREHGLAGRISAIAVAEHEMGAAAARLLYEMRTGKRPIDDEEQIVFPISELPGDTVGPAPEAT